MKTPPLRVRPNPFHTLDPDGMPAGIARVDPSVGRRGVVEFIGATVTKTTLKGEIIEGVQNEKLRPMYRRRATSVVFAKGVIEIPETDIHKQYVQTGALIAEDAATAKTCGVAFLPPEEVLAAFKARAVADWRANHGEDPPIADWDAAPKIDPPEPDKAPAPLARPWDAPVPPKTAAASAQVS